MKARLDTNLDGLVSVYEEVHGRNSFGAKTSTELKDIFKDCPYHEMSCRQSDNELAESMDFSLSMKIRIQYCSLLKRRKKYIAIIDGAKYNVKYIDSDNANTYIYLEYVKEVSDEN